ncbi:hypothetical protein J7T55_014051 [Diaporthe amygdali]|uniref:uncharacterized protein n=1 Tax=Phomopsis amygdali TaxID=1214568 RepID=UPI0022FEBCD7|nr:uncharacterized protein J7T55_014051 [Diaporthe amygdali]KAJ0119846.1 hypothetical protein J7T55_014051 [Diaporthe amygdali]
MSKRKDVVYEPELKAPTDSGLLQVIGLVGSGLEAVACGLETRGLWRRQRTKKDTGNMGIQTLRRAGSGLDHRASGRAVSERQQWSARKRTS